MSIQKFTTQALLSFQLDPHEPDHDPASSVRRATKLEMPGRDGAQIGVWEASPGRFTREVVAGEIMHIVSGAGTFTSDDGESMAIAAGDTLIFSPNTRGQWHITSALRKVYVLL